MKRNEPSISFLANYSSRSLIGQPLCQTFRLTLTLLALCTFGSVAPTFAQEVVYNHNTADLKLRNNLRVNPSTHALEFEIMLGSYSGRGGTVPITISYSSKLWRVAYQGFVPPTPNSDGYTSVGAYYEERSLSGWNSSLAFPVIIHEGDSEIYSQFGWPLPPESTDCDHTQCYRIDRVLIQTPDGSSHELRSSDQPYNVNNSFNLPFPTPDLLYAVDGSRLCYQRSTKTLFMRDGSRYVLGSTPQYIDRNGNKLTFSGNVLLPYTAGLSDTLARNFTSPLQLTAGDYAYAMPGVNNSSINYTLKWRRLGDPNVLTTSQPLNYLADACGDSTLGGSPNLFTSNPGLCFSNGIQIFNPVVLNQIVLPTGQSYTFTYTIYGEIDKVVFPSGGYERYEYNTLFPLSAVGPFYGQANRGVTKRSVSASGNGADEVVGQYAYTGASPFTTGGYDPYVLSTTAPDNSLSERYLHRNNLNGGFGFNPEQAREGMVYDERFYSAPDGTGVRHMLRRKLTDWAVTGSNANSSFPAAQQSARRNPRVAREVEIIFETGGSALAKTTIYEYDLTYQFSTGVNETALNEYNFVTLDQTAAQTVAIGSVPTGTLLRRTEKTYLDVNQAYRDRNILGLITSLTVYKGLPSNANIVSRSTISYDETSLLPYTPPSTWTDPGSYRGNATTTSHWLNFNGSTLSTFPQGTYVVAHAQYDQFGNSRIMTDQNQKQSQIDYSITYKYAYPTTVSSAIPDPSGQSGSSSPLVTTTEFDFNTGKIVSTTDPNLKTTNYDYTDPLNRLKQVTLPNTGRVRYNYFDLPADLYVQVLSDEDSSRSIETRQYFDGLGRSTRNFLYDGTVSTPWLVTNTYYDTMGRILKVSNPYRVSTPGAAVPPTCSVCTTTGYDELNRVLTVTTADSAQVVTKYSAATSGTLGLITTVTDQAVKKRRSLTDALGRLVRVDEPNKDTGNLDVGGASTLYTYDVLGNLCKVDQGGQLRFFMYDSLSRLIRAKNPEQTAASVVSTITDTITSNNQWSAGYGYDNNGNLTTRIDARNVTTTYAYDALNRNYSRSYSDGTPAVAYNYDAGSVPNSKGRMTSVSSSVSSYGYTSYDAVGRIEGGTQTTDGQAYTMGYAYDLAGNMISQTYPSGRVVESEYDNAARLAGVKNLASGAFYAGGASTDTLNRLQYTPHGATSQMRLGNGLWEHTIFNLRLQPIQIGLGSAGTNSSFLQLDYSYGTTDNNGNVQSLTITVPTVAGVNGFIATQNFTYDALSRLASAQENGGASWKQNFFYDRFGNRTFVAGTTFPAQLNASNNPVINPNNNRIDTVASGQTSYSYDGAGNLTHDAAVHAFGYDAENKQRTYDGGATTNGGATYYYDGDGQRVKKVVGGPTIVTTVFVYNIAGQLIAEYGGTSGSGGTSYLTSDTLGTPRVITGSNQAIKSRHDYLPFGEEPPSGSAGRASSQGYVADNLRQKFTQKERDNETGLDYFGARYLASTQGRFTSVDPYNIVREAQVTAQSDRYKAVVQLERYLSAPEQWNRYVYAANNPLKYIDPTGQRIELTGGTQAEREAALERLKILVGKEGAKHLSIQEENGHYYVKSDVNLCDVSGPNDSGTLNYYMSELIDRTDHTVEYKITDSFTTKDGTTVSTAGIKCGGACTVGSEESTTGNTQIFVNKNSAVLASAAMNTPGNAGKYSAGPVHFDDDIVDAHEFGHGYANAIEGKPLHNSKATDGRAIEWENLQRGTYPSWPERRKIH